MRKEKNSLTRTSFICPFVLSRRAHAPLVLATLFAINDHVQDVLYRGSADVLQIYYRDFIFLSQVLSWLTNKGEHALVQHGDLANSLPAIRQQEQDFEKFYFVSMVSNGIAQ